LAGANAAAFAGFMMVPGVRELSAPAMMTYAAAVAGGLETGSQLMQSGGRYVDYGAVVSNSAISGATAGIFKFASSSSLPDTASVVSNTQSVKPQVKMDLQYFAESGIKNNTGTISNISNQIPINKPVVVIGKSMGRVNPVAAQLRQNGFNVKTYNPRNLRSSSGYISRLDLEANRSWLKYWTYEKGATIVDIGLDPSRPIYYRSPFYAIEYKKCLYKLELSECNKIYTLKGYANMDKKLQEFFSEIKNKFSFLEQYGYECLEENIKNPDCYPDSEAIVRYIDKFVCIEISWYFAGAIICISFIESIYGQNSEKRVFWGNSNSTSRAIDLYSLAKYLRANDIDYFFLKNIEDVSYSSIKKREKVINTQMYKIIDGLSRATKYLANNIIHGDTSIFNEVMEFQTNLTKLHN